MDELTSRIFAEQAEQYLLENAHKHLRKPLRNRPGILTLKRMPEGKVRCHWYSKNDLVELGKRPPLESAFTLHCPDMLKVVDGANFESQFVTALISEDAKLILVLALELPPLPEPPPKTAPTRKRSKPKGFWRGIPKAA